MDLSYVSDHYKAKREALGPCAQGVDWKDDAAQMDRLHALRLLMGSETGYTLNDWGCGYGEMGWLVRKECSRYHGYDLVEQYVKTGTFHLSDTAKEEASYTVASGLFNVKGEAIQEDWQRYVLQCIGVMNTKSRKGFGFNCLSDASDKKRPDLYYANPYGMARICMDYGRVSLLQYYSPYDFTILVSKC